MSTPTTNTPDEPSCHACGRRESQTQAKTEDEEPSTLHWCGGCMKVLYCSRQCQRSQWQQHKEECIPRGSVMLGLAMEQGERKTVKRFARHKGCKKHLNYSSPTSIHGAPSWFQCIRTLQTQDLDPLEIILKGGQADLEKSGKDGYTPLMLFCSLELLRWETEILPFVKLILEAGVDVNKKAFHGETALFLSVGWAEVGPTVEIVKTLLEAGADTEILYPCDDFDGTSQQTLLQQICETQYSDSDESYDDFMKNKFDIASVFVSSGANVNANSGIPGKPPLQTIVERSGVSPADLPMLELLLSNGANVDARDNAGCTALMTAAVYSKKRGRTDVMEYLLGAGADPNVKSTSELFLADDIFTGLNVSGHTAITIAIDQIFKPAVEVLLQSHKVDFSVGGPDSQNLWRFVTAKVKTLKRQRSLSREHRKDYDEMVQISRLMHSYMNENGIAV